MSYSLSIPPRPEHTHQGLLLALLVSLLLHVVFLFITRNFEISSPPVEDKRYTVELLPSRTEPPRPLPEATPLLKEPMKVQPRRRAERTQPPSPLEKQQLQEELKRPEPVEKPKPKERRFDRDVAAVELPPPQKQEKPPEAAYADRYNRSVPLETRLRGPARDAMRRSAPTPAPTAPAQPRPAPRQTPPPLRSSEAERARDSITLTPLPRAAEKPKEGPAPQARTEDKPHAAPTAAAENRREAALPAPQHAPAENAAPLPKQVKRSLDDKTLKSMKRLLPRARTPVKPSTPSSAPRVLESDKSPSARAVSPPVSSSAPPTSVPRVSARNAPQPPPPAATTDKARPSPAKKKRPAEVPPEKTMVASLPPQASPPVSGAPSARLPAPDAPKIPKAFLRPGADNALKPKEEKQRAEPKLQVADLLGNVGAVIPPTAPPSPNALPGTTDQDGNIDRGVFGPRVNMNTLSQPRYFSYFTKLKGAITRSWSYPRAAVEKAQLGEGTMKISIDRMGRLVAWELTRTTGYGLLDDAFMRAVRQAEYPAFPDEWPEPGIDLTINFRYTLGRPFFYSR